MRVFHSERSEDVVLEELIERFFGDYFDQATKYFCGRAVFPGSAGLEVEWQGR